MREVDSVIENFVCQKLFGGLLTLTEIKQKVNNLKPEQLSLRVTAAFVGLHEEGVNSGPLIESIQKTIGTPAKQPWCADLQQCIEALVEKWLDVTSDLPESESCLTIFSKAKALGQTVEIPAANDLIVWQHWNGSGSTQAGHVGRIIITGDTSVKTVEGNTGPQGGVQREGDGVYEKYRSLKDYNSMHVLGFVRVTYNKK